jgi:hypothetical protein
MVRILPGTRPCRRLLLLLALFGLLGLAGCTGSTRVTRMAPFQAAAGQEVLPVLPFVNTLVPDSFAESVFNTYIDTLNDNRSGTPIKWFTIVKDDFKEAARLLPAGHLYLAGEVWSYIENSGCCSTELRVNARLRLYRSGTNELLMEIQLPTEGFFDHDRSTLAVERERLAHRLATDMARQTLQVMKASGQPLPAPGEAGQP